MVEYSSVVGRTGATAVRLDAIFRSLADGTRRDILRRVAKEPLSISELAERYTMSFAAIAKHVVVLEQAGLVLKKKEGKTQIVAVVPKTIHIAEKHLREYEKVWNARFNALDSLLK